MVIGDSPLASLSIITVTLNSARHIRNAIESVLRQADCDFELIVIDGRSSDGTVGIVESYRPLLGNRLHLISERDSGLYDAMNKGIALATGSIIGILNSDDEYLPGALAAVRHAFATPDVEIVFGDVLIGPDNSSAELFRTHLSETLQHMTLAHPACFVQRSVYSALGVFDTRFRIAADYDFLLRCYLGGVRFLHVDHTLARFTPGGVSSKSFRVALEVYAIHSRHVSRKHAMKWFIWRISNVAFFGVRRSIGVTLLGPARYEKLAQRRRATRHADALKQRAGEKK